MFKVKEFIGVIFLCGENIFFLIQKSFFKNYFSNNQCVKNYKKDEKVAVF